MGRVRTGIDAIDRRLDGGFAPGSLVALVTPPAVQSHLLLQELMRLRRTIYFTTLRPRGAIHSDISFTDELMPLAIREVGETASAGSRVARELTGSQVRALQTTERDGTLDEIHDGFDDITDAVNVVIDPTNPLERGDSRSAYQTLLSSLAARLLETDSIAILHCTLLEAAPAFRETTLTMADVVWELEVVEAGGSALEVQARIPKNRGGDPVLERMTLVLTEAGVHTDDSRAI